MGKASRHKHARHPGAEQAATAPAPASVPAADFSQPLPSLTGIRGLAALMVLGFHLHNSAGGLPAFTQGWVGVGIFFTLSGFLLTLPLLEASGGGFRLPGRGYAVRRLARVLPSIWAQMLVLAVLAAAGYGGFLQWKGIADAAQQFTLLFHIGPEPIRPWLSHWWTVPVELGFYLLLPLLLRIANRIGTWSLLGFVVLAWLYRAALIVQFPQSPELAFWLENSLGRMDQFALGVLAAWYCQRHAERLRPKRHALLLLGLALFVALLSMKTESGFLVKPGWGVVWHGGIGVAVALILVGLRLGDSWLDWLLSWKPLAWVGTVSYSLYLWHYPIILWLQGWNWLASVAGTGERQLLMLVASLLVAAVSWWLFERPAQLASLRHRQRDCA